MDHRRFNDAEWYTQRQKFLRLTAVMAAVSPDFCLLVNIGQNANFLLTPGFLTPDSSHQWDIKGEPLIM
jgi:hypothetical protein